MDYIDGFIDAFPPAFDDDASEAESAATNQRYQQALDTLYSLGCKYDVTVEDMRPLCDHMDVSFNDLLKHNTSKFINTTKATS